jgi:hypothetical protein
MNELKELAATIREHHFAARLSEDELFEHWVQCGKLLQRAQMLLLGSGETWWGWVESNLPFETRQAQKYIRIAQNEITLRNMRNANSGSRFADGNMSINALLASIATPRPESPERRRRDQERRQQKAEEARAERQDHWSRMSQEERAREEAYHEKHRRQDDGFSERLRASSFDDPAVTPADIARSSKNPGALVENSRPVRVR